MTNTDIAIALTKLTEGMIYISESERPLEVLGWDANNSDELRSKIAAFTGQEESALVQNEAAAFFEGIQRMADPADQAMMEYAERYSKLSDFVQNHLTDLSVIKAGKVEVHVFITGFTSEEHKAVMLHTIAIQT